jgi:hypothetical protein
LLDRLEEADQIDWSRASLDSASVPAKRGARRLARTRRIAANQGSKRHVVSDWKRVPLAVALPAANGQDSKVFEDLVDTSEPITCPKRSRPRQRPENLHADQGYDFGRCRKALRERGIKACIARRGKDFSERLGRHWWVVEHTLAELVRYRRLVVRYERRADSTRRSSISVTP